MMRAALMKPGRSQARHGREGAAWLALASRSAKQAAATARALAGNGKAEVRPARRATWRDIKIRADGALERVIGDTLRAHSPFPVVSEERSGADRAPHESGLCWIVDPLDGSLNCSRGIPLWCISIALWRGETPVLGVIHDVNRGEHFTGLAGSGAWLNGEPIRVSRVADPREAVLCTGFPVFRDFASAPLARFVRDVQRYKRIRMLGSAALSLAYVACGRADLYQEDTIALWDVAAGIALVEAAGGKVERALAGIGRCMTVRAANAALLQRAEGTHATS